MWNSKFLWNFCKTTRQRITFKEISTKFSISFKKHSICLIHDFKISWFMVKIRIILKKSWFESFYSDRKSDWQQFVISFLFYDMEMCRFLCIFFHLKVSFFQFAESEGKYSIEVPFGANFAIWWWSFNGFRPKPLTSKNYSFGKLEAS